MMFLKQITLGSLLIAATTLAIGKTSSNSSQPTPDRTAKKQVHPDSPNPGQQVFVRNCSRCHNAPEGFSQSVSAAVAMHMRVRAGLSEADYKALCKFLNP